jgi:hypothetical protein
MLLVLEVQIWRKCKRLRKWTFVEGVDGGAIKWKVDI